ncbi:hypothetical protein [Streptomyces sp. NPDC001665]
MAVIQHEEQVHVQERPELTLGEAVEQLAHSLPGHRVEIFQGRLTVTPPADGTHAPALSWLGEEFGARARETGGRCGAAPDRASGRPPRRPECPPARSPRPWEVGVETELSVDRLLDGDED